jgi:hypothetical protein
MYWGGGQERGRGDGRYGKRGEGGEGREPMKRGDVVCPSVASGSFHTFLHSSIKTDQGGSGANKGKDVHEIGANKGKGVHELGANKGKGVHEIGANKDKGVHETCARK